MSRAYDTIEPSVVDEEMLQKAVEEQGPKEEAGRIAKEEGIDFADVAVLRLDFRNILKIENLWCFKKLTKLQLDNNIIEKIEGLDTLVTLVWLDLSFNNIEVIEGLDKLVNLEDLTLHNNRIQKLEGMDALKKLHVFSVGNNEIKDIEGSIKYLRKFKHLQTLNFSGNPICELEQYKRYVAAFLPQLEYLDYRLIDDVSRADGLAAYDATISSMQHEEEEAQRKETEAENKEKEKQYHREAYVENLNGPDLFLNLYADDVDGKKLQTLQAVKDMDVDFEKKFTAVCQQIFEYGLKKHEERAQEVKVFWECIRDAKDENRKQGMTAINEIQVVRKQLLQDLHNIQDQAVINEKVGDYSQKVNDLWNLLMTYEMQLVDQLEEVIKDFERNINEAVQLFLEVVQGYVTQLRDFENQHHEKLTEIAMVTMEKVAKNEAEEMADEVRDLFADKDTITNVLASSHDAHLLKIDNREDDIVTKIRAWSAALLQTAHDEENVKRNRARVTEINMLCDHLKEEVQDMLDLQNNI